jgi:hypothetical protein
VFCFDQAYRFDDVFKEAVINRKRLPTKAPYYTHEKFLIDSALPHVGLDRETLSQHVIACADLHDFAVRFANHYASFRKRSISAWAEKTPINVGCLPKFCTQFPNGMFLHVVRDGRSVVASLMNRGFSLYEAAYVWIWQVLQGRRATGWNNAMEVRYEDLTASPFETVAQIGERLGISVDAKEVEKNFRSNKYREQMPRVKGWTHSQFSGDIRKPPSFEERLSSSQVALLEALVLEFPYDGSAEMRGARFADLLRNYGYDLSGHGANNGNLERLLLKYAKQHLLESPHGNLKQAALLSVRNGRAVFPVGARTALSIRKHVSWRIGSALLRVFCR